MLNLLFENLFKITEKFFFFLKSTIRSALTKGLNLLLSVCKTKIYLEGYHEENTSVYPGPGILAQEQSR